MLVLQRKVGERIVLGDGQTFITVAALGMGFVMLTVDRMGEGVESLRVIRERPQTIQHDGVDVTLSVTDGDCNNRVRIGVSAPNHIRIDREEVWDRTQQETKA